MSTESSSDVVRDAVRERVERQQRYGAPPEVGRIRERSLVEADLIEAVELPLLLEAVFQRYGYDFRDYAGASLKRRLRRAVAEEGLASLSALQERILRDEAAMARLLDRISVDVSGMFRDPTFFQALRDKVVPMLHALPLIRVWHAGCASGEEVYSLAILLHEEDLLRHSKRYATDMNERLLTQGKAAVFPIKHMQEYTKNYQRSGGQANFSDYYAAKHDGAILREFLRDNIVWAPHNLATDASFNEFQLILCRNVLIYFNHRLQERVLRLLNDSLAVGGILGLGRGESLQFTPCQDCFEIVDGTEKLYRKVK